MLASLAVHDFLSIFCIMSYDFLDLLLADVILLWMRSDVLLLSNLLRLSDIILLGLHVCTFLGVLLLAF